MTIEDATCLQRIAQFLVVEARRGYGSPPVYDLTWQPVWGAKVDRIVIRSAARSSTATIWFPDLRWHLSFNLVWGDNIRIRTNECEEAQRTVLFTGFITNYVSEFSGGGQAEQSRYERNAIVCQDYRWLLSVTSPVFGQFIRGPDDYSNYGQSNQAPLPGSCFWASGRRAIFNADGRPNRDPTAYTHGSGCYVPIFAETDIAWPWTARDMVCYLLSPLLNLAYQWFPIPDPSLLSGLDHTDWDKVITHIVVEGLNVIEAVELVCKHIGWGFREEYLNDGTVQLVFYKVAAAAGYTRTSANPTIMHRLHAPAEGETITNAVAYGCKMLCAMSLAEDIAAVVNTPWGLGSPHRFEFTTELVPAWYDSDLVPDTSEDNANLFFTEADLQDITDPNTKNYYKYYHPRGSDFYRNVARKWCLNESGRYSSINTCDRGMPFDFTEVIDPYYILDSAGKRIYAPFNRQLLPCLTQDIDGINSVGIVVEFSFDGGTTWQVIPASITSLKDEAGIYIDEENLAEMVDEKESTISGGDLDGEQLNYWTSLADDKLNSRSFKNGQWKTRIRVTASIQLDQRLTSAASPSSASGSPFNHRQLYDFSDKYHLKRRTPASLFYDSTLTADEADSTIWFGRHLQAVRSANEDMSISGLFTLERLWLGDGAAYPDFAIGDFIERITGREYSLATSFGGGNVYPEVIEIIYLPDIQQMKLVTRDLRFADVSLEL